MERRAIIFVIALNNMNSMISHSPHAINSHSLVLLIQNCIRNHAITYTTTCTTTTTTNEVRDLTANLMAEVCHDVCIKPTLQPVTGERLSGASTITNEGAGWILPQAGFGEDATSVPFLMFESLIPMPSPIASPSQPAIESTRTLKTVHMNNVSVRLSMVPSLSSFSQQQED